MLPLVDPRSVTAQADFLQGRIGASPAAPHNGYAVALFVSILGLILLAVFVLERFRIGQRRDQEKLQHIEERLEAIVMLSPAVPYTAKAEPVGFTITFMGDNAIEVLGFAPQELAVPGAFRERIHPDDRNASTPWRPPRASNAPRNIAFSILTEIIAGFRITRELCPTHPEDRWK